MIADTRADIPPNVLPPPIPKHIVHWYGKATGRWWAMLPGRRGPSLIEAASEEQLAALVDWHVRMASP